MAALALELAPVRVNLIAAGFVDTPLSASLLEDQLEEHGPPFPPEARQPGPDPERSSYGSFFSFTDPDGNTWLLQEVTARLPGRIDATETASASTPDLADALRRAEAAHGEHEKRTGRPHLLHRPGHDEDWPTVCGGRATKSRTAAKPTSTRRAQNPVLP